MFKYKVKFFENDVVEEFESKLHIATRKAVVINGASLVYFGDAKIAINLAQVEEMEIDGKKYLMKSYEV